MKNNFKFMTSILLWGIILNLTVSMANTKIAYPADFELKLNGRVVTLENADVMAIEGRTYLPLAALCQQLLGMSVNWVNETQTVEMWNITKPEDSGSHEFPVPLGKVVTGEFQDDNEKYVPYSVAITEVVRGESVEEWLRQEYLAIEENKYPEKEIVTREKEESNEEYQERLDMAERNYIDAVNGWEENYNRYLLDLGKTSVKEFLRAKVNINIVQANSNFKYETSLDDLVPYSGKVNVEGLERQFVRYDVSNPQIDNEKNYAGRIILTNGVYEGYYVVPVYKEDTTPRVIYKDGQCLALYN